MSKTNTIHTSTDEINDDTIPGLTLNLLGYCAVVQPSTALLCATCRTLMNQLSLTTSQSEQ